MSDSDKRHVTPALSRRKLLASVGTAAAGWVLTGAAGFGTGTARAEAGVGLQTATPAWINVKQYGAQGNGRPDQDDMPAFRSAVEALGRTGGGVLYVPPGKYSLSGALTLWSNIRLVGDGPEVSVLQSIQFAHSLIQCTKVTGITVEGIGLVGLGTLNGAKDVSAAEKGVQLTECENVRVEHCSFSNMANGLWLTDCRHVVVSECSFRQIFASESFYEGYGVSVEGGAHQHITDNRFKGLGKPCINVYGGSVHGEIGGNVAEESKDAFIVLSSRSKPCSHYRIEGNTASDAGLAKDALSCTEGIVLRGYCTDHIVTGNILLRPKSAGILLEGEGKTRDERLAGHLISGNRVSDTDRGIVVLNSDGNAVTGNAVRRAKTGILLDSADSGDGAYSRGNLVAGNMLWNCTAAGIRLATAGCEETVVYGNGGAGNAEALVVHEKAKVGAGF